MDIESIGRRAAADLHQQAARAADSEQALAELEADIAAGVTGADAGLASARPPRRLGRLSPAQWTVIGTSVAAAVAITAFVVAGGERERQLAPASSTPGVSEPLPTDAPTTVPPSTQPTTSAPPSTVMPFLSALGYGLGLGGMNVDGVVAQEYIGPEDARSSVAFLVPYDSDVIRLQMSDAPLPADVPGRDLGGGVTVTAEVATTDSDGLVADGVIDSLLSSLVYDPAEDDRVYRRSDPPFAAAALCDDAEWSFAGAPGLPDMVLFTCDGTLARFDGETGELIESIGRFGWQVGGDPPADPSNEFIEGLYDLAVSPDGTTLYYSWGGEPISGNTSRHAFGSTLRAVNPGSPGLEDAREPGGSTSFGAGGQRVSTSLNVLGVTAAAPGDTTVGYDLINSLAVGKAAISPDGSRLAVEVASGILAVVDTATGGVDLIANEDPAVRFFEPSFRDDGTLMALVSVSGDVGDSVEDAVVGDDGTLVEVSSPGNWVLPFADVEHAPLVLRNTTLTYGESEDPIGTGILRAVGIPGTAAGG